MRFTLSFSTFLLAIFLVVSNTILAQITSAIPVNAKPTLLIFSGSDWCKPCIKLKKDILDTEVFQNFASTQLNIVVADFPQKKKIAKETEQQNELLADKYNPEGLFPQVLLLDMTGKVIKIINHIDQTPARFIKQIEDILPKTKKPVEYRRKAMLMGCAFSFTIVDKPDSKQAEQLLDLSIQEVTRIENLISEWKEDTQISQLNKLSGKQAVTLDKEVYDLIQRAIKVSDITNGAFDITFNGMSNLWVFDNQKHHKLPEEKLIQEQLKNIGYQYIDLQDNQKVYLQKQGASIGFGAIGKGYAADKVKLMLLEKGVESGIVNASGDLIAWGNSPDGLPWKVGIADPDDASHILFWIPLKNAAIATSGNYEKFFEYNGKRYAHILNPKTGYPVTEIKSVSVISPSAELSDALATAIFVMGIKDGLELIELLPEVECLIIDSKNEFHFSSNLEYIKQ